MLAGISYPPIPIFELGPLNLSLHGLFAGLGFLAGAALMVREARRRGFDADKITSVLTWALVASILGARFFTVPGQLLTSSSYGFSDAISLTGDYSILGGYAGGILVGAWRMRMLRLRVPVTLDMAAAGLAIGAVVGRIGDLAIVEHLGGATSFFLGYTVEPGYELSPQHRVLQNLCDTEGLCGTFHHTALYDMLGAAALLGVIYWLRRRWTTRRYGQLFSIWVIWYGLQRFVIDFTRLGAARDGWEIEGGRVVDNIIADSVLGPLTGSQWGALGGALLGVLLLLWWRRMPAVTDGQDDVYRAEAEGPPAGPALSEDDADVMTETAMSEEGAGAETPAEGSDADGTAAGEAAAAE